MGRVECQLRENKRFDMTLAAANDTAWNLARSLAYSLHEDGYQGVRCLISFYDTPYVMSPLTGEPRGVEIEDDIPF